MEMQSDTFRAMPIVQFFTFEGRVPRAIFWINTLVCGLVSFAVSLMFMEVRTSIYPVIEQSYHISNKPIYYIATVVIVLRVLSVSVRRWQDIGKDGIYASAYFYPVLAALFPNFIFYTGMGTVLAIVGSIVLLVAVGFQGFVPGDQGANQYGPEPEEVVIL